MFKGHKMSSSETCCSLAFSFHSSTKMKSDRLHGEPKPSVAVHLSQNQLGWGFPASYFIRLAKYTSVTQNSVVVLLRGINISAGMQETTTNIICSDKLYEFDMKTKGFFFQFIATSVDGVQVQWLQGIDGLDSQVFLCQRFSSRTFRNLEKENVSTLWCADEWLPEFATRSTGINLESK